MRFSRLPLRRQLYLPGERLAIGYGRRETMQAFVDGTSKCRLELGSHRTGEFGGEMIFKGLFVLPHCDHGRVIGAVELFLQEENDGRAWISLL